MMFPGLAYAGVTNGMYGHAPDARVVRIGHPASSDDLDAFVVQHNVVFFFSP
jgi:hypothetical protein